MFHNKKIIAIFVLLAGCTLICAASQLDVDLKSVGPESIPLAVDVEKKTTKATTTTTSTSTTSTTTTTSTTPEPTTSSTTTSTSTTTTTSTTAAPDTTTTTVAPSTTTPKPAPYPGPEIGTWNSSCIMIKMAAQLNFTYLTKDNNTKQALYNIPKEATVYDSHCGNLTQTIQLNWGASNAQQSFVMSFGNVNDSVTVSMIQIVLTLGNDTYPDAKDETIQLIHRGVDEFKSPLKMSYHCTRPQILNVTETLGSTNVTGTLKLHDVQLEAFRATNAQGFSTVHDCDSSEVTDIVPFAVGIALVGLILVVLIAYLAARYRANSQGYMSF